MKLYEFENCKGITTDILELIYDNKLKVTYLTISDVNDGNHINVAIGCKNKINIEKLTKQIKNKFGFSDLTELNFTDFDDGIRITFNLYDERY